ncbi:MULTISPECIES: hypothetical protein [unclassified Colwellia]|uniref:hypothetical protein n=1 Tax=unclassified Colwellia TaxID=196834 RepID=UPI0015F4E018|nr:MULTISPECIES: hypothetical protein [unclassified Colwellia]MBA6231473.1 hypothetical protein [Colwellia sp. MB02u-7]MBA6238436.1 hypothetical protein [Colwellia sp. MB02u-11]MBA6255210.1 hypothetical protein [Colwellia sp. MB3u-28]MBA6260785.1 hypothetical protein [Colwellia sp. MB3u-41]MBA6299606.1 hypothetical protein [Colwellia sp. MB3u-22]
MNQQIIFNDDISFDDSEKGWVFTGLLSGERISILIKCKKHDELTDELKFNLEEIIEEWLEDNEPLSGSRIEVVYT